MTQATGLIPDELLANVKKGDRVLFLGRRPDPGLSGCTSIAVEVPSAPVERRPETRRLALATYR